LGIFTCSLLLAVSSLRVLLCLTTHVMRHYNTILMTTAVISLSSGPVSLSSSLSSAGRETETV
jgi:hypothetical protein